MKFSLHYSVLLVAATVACVAAAPTTTGPQETILSVAHRIKLESNKIDQDKAVIAQKKTVAEKELEAAKALADKLGLEAATARESATGFKETAEQTRQTVVTSLGDAVNAYTRAKESYEKISGTPELDEEVLQNLKNKHENALNAIGANNIGRSEALLAALVADMKEQAADDAKTTVDGYAFSIGQLTEDDNKISQKVDRLRACANDFKCSITAIFGDNIEEPVDEINTAEDETAANETNEDKIDPNLTGSDLNQVKEDKVDKDMTGTADDNDAEDLEVAEENDRKMKVGKEEERMEVGATKITEQETPEGKAAEENVSKMKVGNEEERMEVGATRITEQETPEGKAAEENDSKMKVGNEEERMEVGATKITEQETPEGKAAEKKHEEIAAEKEKKEKRVKDAAREAAGKKNEEVAKEEKASEKVKKDKAAKKDEEAEVVAEEGEATKKGEMKGEDKTVQEEKAGESGEKKGEDKTKNAVVQDSGAKFNQPAVAVGILSVMFALAFGV